MNLHLGHMMDADDEVADDGTLADIWSALQETNSNLEKCNEIINKFYAGNETEVVDRVANYEEATFTLSDNSMLIHETAGFPAKNSRYKDYPENSIVPKVGIEKSATQILPAHVHTSLQLQNNASAAARPPQNQQKTSRKKPSSGRKCKKVAKLRKRLRVLRREVRARDLRLGQLEGAVSALADLSTRSQRAYYVLLHEIARQLFETADLLQIGDGGASAPAPTASLAPWFETLYLLSRKIKHRLLQKRSSSESPLPNGTLEIRLAEIMSRLETSLSFHPRAIRD